MRVHGFERGANTGALEPGKHSNLYNVVLQVQYLALNDQVERLKIWKQRRREKNDVMNLRFPSMEEKPR